MDVPACDDAAGVHPHDPEGLHGPQPTTAGAGAKRSRRTAAAAGTATEATDVAIASLRDELPATLHSEVSQMGTKVLGAFERSQREIAEASER
eukprot:11812516-Alexandrium_andersonii.AAC.1